MIESILTVIGCVMILAGLIILISSVIGVYRFRYVLNRMHAAAMGDTLGILLVLGGLAVMSGLTPLSLKLVLTIAMLWLTSPVSSHLIGRLEVLTNEKKDEHYREVRH